MARTRKHKGVGATGGRDSSESAPQGRTNGLCKADEEIWKVTSDNGEEEKERTG